MIFHLKRATSKLDKQNRKIFKKSFFLQRIFDNSVKNSDEKENDFKRKALTCFLPLPAQKRTAVFQAVRFGLLLCDLHDRSFIGILADDDLDLLSARCN